MGSGYFPLDRNTESGKKLLEAMRLIEEVKENFYDEVYSGSDGQFDNAARDGGFLALLGLAKRLIREELEKEN
jgi:hypothetical protein